MGGEKSGVVCGEVATGRREGGGGSEDGLGCGKRLAVVRRGLWYEMRRGGGRAEHKCFGRGGGERERYEQKGISAKRVFGSENLKSSN